MEQEAGCRDSGGKIFPPGFGLKSLRNLWVQDKKGNFLLFQVRMTTKKKRMKMNVLRTKKKKKKMSIILDLGVFFPQKIA